MKPIKLTMYGFMTYKEKTTIDFTKLYPSRIFVISGDTGSGKTSIFDAISFALFGSISRPSVEQIDLRCDFLSEADPPTYVNFVFEVDGKFYEIERKPLQYAKRKVRPGVRIDHEVSLFEIKKDKTELLSDKTRETNSLIKEIIGLDQNQLKKVMLLAQGQFSEFLSADSATKAELLSDIFQTSLYGKIQEDLKEKAKSYGKDLENLDLRLEEQVNKDQTIASLIDETTLYRHDFEKINETIRQEIEKRDKNIEKLSLKQKKKNKDKEDLIDKLAKLDQENKQIILYKDLEKEKENLEAKKSSYENLKNSLQRAKNAHSIKPYYERLEEIKNEKEKISLLIKEKTKEKASVQADFKTLKEEKNKLPDLISKVDRLKIDLNTYQDKEKSLNEFIEIKAAYDKSFKDKARLKKLEEDLVNEKNDEKIISEKLLARSNELVDTKDLGSTYMVQKNELDKSLDKNKDLKEKLKNNKALEEKIRKLDQEDKKLDLDISLAKKDLDLALKNQENIEKQKFIKILNETQICPICGSFHEKKIEEKETYDLDLEALRSKYHKLKNKKDLGQKEIALLKENLVSDLPKKEDIESEEKSLILSLKSLDEKIKSHKKNLQDINENIGLLKEEKSNKDKSIQNLEKQREDLNRKLLTFDQVESKYLSMKDSYQDLDQALLREKISSLKESIAGISKKIDELNRVFARADKKLAQLESVLATSKDNLKAYEKSFEENKETFSKKLEEYFASKEEFLETLNSYEDLKEREEDIEKFFDSYKTIKIRLDSLKGYKDKELIDLESFENDLKKLNQDLEGLTENLTKENIKSTLLKEISREVKDIEKLYKEKATDSQIIGRLAKIASGGQGAVKGREKLDFETFVLIYYFEKILAYSNKRLFAMSNGQYRMVRKTEGGDMRSKQGLDIEIIDANTGKSRPASTLSGGETFLASLSLALGLSDEISAENGGVKIDTLFIDEGFGTLSDSYLENAIVTIEKLSYENKFIGLISHVKEVKDAIDAKILVKYDKSQGSEVEIVI